jgi:hypothetical protein
MKRKDFKKKPFKLIKNSEILAIFIISAFSSLVILGFPKFSLNIATKTELTKPVLMQGSKPKPLDLPVLDGTLKPSQYDTSDQYYLALSNKANLDATQYSRWSITDPKNADYYEAKRIKSLKLSQKYLDQLQNTK